MAVIIVIRNVATGLFVGPPEGPQHVKIALYARRFETHQHAMMNRCQGEEVIEIKDPNAKLKKG